MADLKTSQEELLTELSGNELVRVSVPISDGYESAAAPASLFISTSGGLQGLTFTSDTGSIDDSDPGAGLFKWNNATQGSATFLYFDNATLDAISATTFFAALGATGFVRLQQSNDATKWQLWQWTVAPTAGSGYYKFAVTLMANGGSIVDNTTVLCDFSASGSGSAATTESAIRAQVQGSRAGRYLQSDGMLRDPLRVGLGTLTVGSPATVTDDTKYNAWPSIERMADGRLCMVYTKGDTHNADNTGRAVCKIGTEGHAGAVTWGSEADVYDHVSLNASAMGIGRTVTGRLIVTLWRGDNTLLPGVRNAEAGIVYSDDDGATWSAWVDLNDGFTQESFGAGKCVQLSNGDLLATVEGTDSGSALNRSSKIVRSTDDGATWGSPVTVRAYATDTRAYYESQLLVLPDESILIAHRTDATTLYFQTSTDGGATWSAPYAGPADVGSAAWISMLSSGTLVIGQRYLVAGANFAGFVAYTSRDLGVTWSTFTVVDSSFVAGGGIMQYASVIELRDNRLLWAYGIQPTAATTNSDIATVIVTEDAQRLTRDVPQNSKSAAYTLLITDANRHLLHPSADTTARIFTIPANSAVPFPVGTAVTFVNQNAGGTITIAITTDTMRLAGAGTTGSRTLTANGIATALKIMATEWLISGTNLT